MEAHKSCPCFLKKKKRYQINKQLWFLCIDCNNERKNKLKKYTK